MEIERVHQDFADLKIKYPELYKLSEWSIRSPHVVSPSIFNLIFDHSFRKICSSLVGTDDEHDYAGLFLKDVPEDISSAIPIILNPGDIACMDSKLIHASTPNFSGRKRRGMIAAYAKSNLIEKCKEQIEEIHRSFLAKWKFGSWKIELMLSSSLD